MTQDNFIFVIAVIATVICIYRLLFKKEQYDRQRDNN